MKKTFFLVALFATVFSCSAFSQDGTKQTALSGLLAHYYSVKDALVADNAEVAAAGSAAFQKAVQGINTSTIPAGSTATLSADAGKIAATKDLKKQRAYFAKFSSDMSALAKTAKLGTGPVYQQYCPMKKAYWLSNSSEIENPYFGSAMPGCGEVTATF